MHFVSQISRSRWMTAATYSITLFVLMTLGASWASAAEGGDTKKPNLIIHIVDSAGWVFGPMMLIVSVGLTALCVLLTLDLRMGIAIPPGFVDEFTDTVNKRRFKEAFDMARNDTSSLARVLTAGMSRLQYGLEDAREAAANMLEGIRSEKEQKNSYTAVIGTLGPLLGLVGTVFGMILAFMELAYSEKTPNPKNLSKGISHALVVTLLGVGVSVPAIFFNAFFRNRIVRISMDTGHIADDLLTQMYHNSKKTGAGAGPSSAGTGTTTAAPR
ncbi:MAG: MotA/TolQ/ExbB proton channel family protein [Planctomycetes bacterium]|nr:MotA/TolQ/ExbB proton channel family protein [Planctomycetota bacterium]